MQNTKIPFPAQLAATTSRKDPLSKMEFDYGNPVSLPKMELQPLLIQHRLVHEDASGNLFFNNITPFVHDYPALTSVGPYTIDNTFIPTADEFRNLYLKRNLDEGAVWYFEPTRFSLLGVLFNKRGFKTYTHNTKQITEVYVKLQKHGEAHLNLAAFVKTATQQVREAMTRGGLTEELAYSDPIVDFAEDEYLRKVNNWELEDAVLGLPIKVKSNWLFRGILDGEAKSFTVDEFNQYLDSGCYFDVVLKPQMWLVKSGEDGRYRCGMNFGIDFLDIRTPAV